MTGYGVIAPSLQGRACEAYLQVFDLATCASSNVSPLAGPAAVTVSELRTGGVPYDTEVSVSDLVVTGMSPYGFWAQAGTASNSGIWIYGSEDYETVYGPIAVGDVVRVRGLFMDYNGLQELSLPDSAAQSGYVVTGSRALPDVLLFTPTQLMDEAFAEQYESMLVRVEDVVVTADANIYDEFPVSDGTGQVLVDDAIYELPVSARAGDQVSYVQGPLYYSFGAFKIAPRRASDIEIFAVTP
jgi:hypothetical protein